MKNPEEALEKVLSGLQNRKAPPGLETRTLRALQNRATAGRPAPKPLWLPRYTLASAAAVLFCVLAIAGLLSRFPATHPSTQARARLSTDIPGANLETHPTPTGAATPVSLRDRRASPGALALKPKLGSPHHNASLRNAVSYPAPPLPLTEQEKLLLRIAHSRKTSEIAPLNPETQIAQAARDKEEFTKFFNQQHEGVDNEPN